MFLYPEFRRERLAAFIPVRLYLAAIVTTFLGCMYLLKPNPDIVSFGIATSIGTATGVVYWLLVRANYHRLTAFIFAPLDFATITVGVYLTHWAPGGTMIFYMYVVITAGMLIGPIACAVVGAMSVVMVMIGLIIRHPTADTMPPWTLELFTGVSLAVVTIFISALVRAFDETTIKQLVLQKRLEGERDRLDAEVARRTEELVQANRSLDNRNTMLALQRRQAEEANRLKSQFLASMSHELRTPLNAINGFADLMLQGIYGPVTAKQQERLGNIMSRANDLLTLINDVLDLAKVEAGRLDLEYSAFDPADVIREVRDTVAPVLRTKGDSVHLALELPIDPIHARCDRARYKQIVLNLVSNALKFTEEGTVTVKLQPGPVDQFTTFVRDTGIGIKREDQERIFEPFQQIEVGPTRRYGGMGLGLYICRQLVTLLRGQIQVSSELQKGSVFTVQLPMQPAADMHDHVLRAIRPDDLDSEGRLTPEALNRQVSELGHQLRAANQQLRGIFDNSPLPMFIYGPQGTILLWNKACESLAQSPGMVAFKNTIQEALYPGASDEISRLIQMVFAGFSCRMAWRGVDSAGNNVIRVGLHYPVLHEHGGVSYAVALLIEPGPYPLEENAQVLFRAEDQLLTMAGPEVIEASVGNAGA